jgi:hypothetical protein
MGTTPLTTFEIIYVLGPKLTSATVCTPIRDVTGGADVRLEAALKRYTEGTRRN